MKVIKRNGEIRPFDFSKIENAINGAFKECRGEKAPETFIKKLRSYFPEETEDRTFTVEELQDIVETELMRAKFFDVAKSYILYRKKHEEIRFIKERSDYMEAYARSSENAASSSETDANANVAVKNVANLNAEVYKSTNRKIQRYNMRKTLKRTSPQFENTYEKDLEHHIIYTHDEASFPMVTNYCEAVSLWPFLLKGTSGMDGTGTKAPTNLSSFAGQFSNLVFLHAAQCKGAVAYGEFFNVLEYYCAKDFGADYPGHLKEFIYLGPKFRRLLRETKTWFDTVEELRSYDFGTDELNATRDEIIYDATRPATQKELKAWKESLKGKALSEIKMGDGTRTIEAQLNQTLQQIVYSINQPAGNRSYQSPFTNISYYDSGYWHALFGEMSYPDGSPLCWERISFLQKHFMRWFNEERTKTMLTFPVETMALLSDGKDIIDQEYKHFTAEMYKEGHSFFTFISDSPNALASCCRLRNEIRENVFSFTNGLTGVQTGSANVITLNHNRIIQDWAKEKGFTREYLIEHFWENSDSYKKYLIGILERVYAYHIAYKTMLYEVEDAKLLTASNEGYIKMTKLFSTIGDNGINEAAEFLGLTCRYNEPYKDFCNLVIGTINEQNRIHSTPRFLFNQEFVPAEGLSSKNCNWDRADGYWIPENRILYNSYFYRADDREVSVLEKFKLHGREFTGLLDGGVGLHVNLEEHLSKQNYLDLIDTAIKNGTSYFTFNIPNSECTNDDCRHIVKKPMRTCPKCGARMRQWSRIIGYMRPIDNFDEYRHAEAETRYYANADHLK